MEVLLDAPVYGLYKHPEGIMVSYMSEGRERAIVGEKVILATGAAENALVFPGGTLPGVMGAGCAQTMINVNRVLPGQKIIMVGSGNVGLIVSYQLMQAGADVLALIEAAPNIGGYGVHAGKIRRAGVPHQGGAHHQAGHRQGSGWRPWRSWPWTRSSRTSPAPRRSSSAIPSVSPWA